MTHTQYITTGIAVSLAVLLGLGLLFFGPAILNPIALFSHSETQSLSATSTDAGVASTTLDVSTSNSFKKPMTNGSGANIPQQLPTELAAHDEVVGTGAEAKAGDTVTVQYVGMLPDGTVFDASSKHQETANGFSFKLGAGMVIKGWDLGVAGMKVGGKRQLIIPPAYGYGANGVPGVIPANATLIFEVELLKVQ